MASSGQPAQVLPGQGEAELFTQIQREFKGVNTKAERSAIPKENFYDLQNVMPIGNANLHSVPGLSAALYAFGGQTIYAAQYAMVQSVPYLFAYSTQGNIVAYNLNTNTASQINGAFTLSAGGVRMAPFYNTYALFIDSTGYYSWNGTTFSQLTGAQMPATGTDIAVFNGMVWVSQGRLILVSAAYNATSTTDPTQNTAWQAANGATFLVMTDPSMVGNITRLWSQNGYLYIFGPTCVWALTDVYVPTGQTEPTPVWTLLPVQSIIGTDQIWSIFPLNRALMFASRFGVWAIEGVNATKVSEDLDGTWQYLTFTQSISGGQAIVQNVLNAAFCVTRTNDPILGTGTVIAMWFQERWWFANVGAATFIVAAIVGNIPVLYAIIGNTLYQVFANAANPPNTQVMTALWDMDAPLDDKQALRAGFDLISDDVTATSSVMVTIDTFNSSTQLPISASEGTIQFTGANGADLDFVGTGPIAWITNAYQLYQAAAPGTYSKFIGMTIRTVGLAFELDSFYMDYKKRKRW